MKNTLKALAASAILFFCASASADVPGSVPFPESLEGTMLPYDFSRTDSAVPWSDDMQPVFINYIARHGARFLSSPKKINRLRSSLLEARADGTLSSKGEDFLRLIQTVDSVTDGRWGALNPVGMEEEKQLARQMVAVAPALLSKGKVKAIATYVPRVVMTMYEFCHELACTSTELEISTSEGRQFDPLLRYFTTDSAYVAFLKHPDWKKEYDRFADATLPTAPAASMFKIGKANSELRKLSLDAYGILQSLPAAGIKTDVYHWFSPAEYRACWEVSNLEHYYERSASSFSDIPIESACPLLESIIASTDEADAWRNEEVAFLRFGHAETILPLFSLMHLPGCYAPDATPATLSSLWNDSDISPLGANLLMVVLKDKARKTFVALRLNGRWLTIDNHQLIPWPHLKSLWQNEIKKSRN